VKQGKQNRTGLIGEENGPGRRSLGGGREPAQLGAWHRED